MNNEFVDSDEEFDTPFLPPEVHTTERVLTPVNCDLSNTPPQKSFLQLLAQYQEEHPEAQSDDNSERSGEEPVLLAADAHEQNIGQRVGEDKFGVWRTVPGVDRLEVSSMGYVRRVVGGKAQPAVLPKPGTLGYRCVGSGGAMHKVSRLVCTAFHGPCPPSYTCLHISKGENMIAARADDRAENLRWASRADLVNSRRKCKRQRTGKPILVRHIEWDDATPSLRFETATEADEKLRVMGLRHAANPSKTILVNRVWKASWVLPEEEQADLPATADQPAEEWREVGDTLRVSNRGRAQTLQNQHRWGRIFVPKCSEGEQYPTVGRHQYFHAVLWRAFDNMVPEGHIIDHLDGKPENNVLSNLRAMSWHEHNAGLGKKRKRFLV